MNYSISYGITTIPERKDTYFPITLKSLKDAGFDKPQIFLDEPKIGEWPRWILSLHELYLRNPRSNRYAIFQDDIVCCRNLKQYIENLDETIIHERYLNLFSFMENEKVIEGKQKGRWLLAASKTNYPNYQYGRGAVALVFSNKGVRDLLTSSIAVNKSLSQHPLDNTDFVVVRAMNFLGYREIIHNPSLVQHIGINSSIGHDWNTRPSVAYSYDPNYDPTQTDSL